MSGDRYVPGDPNVICDYSGFKCRMSQTVRTHDGFRVLKRFVGEETRRHPQEQVRARADRQRVHDPRPEGADVFLNPGDVTAEDL